MADWSFDISSAPRGKTVTTTRTVKDKVQEISEFVPDFVWLATKCGKVIRTNWLPATKFSPARGVGLGVNEQPVAWQLFITPEHPFESPRKAAEAVSERTAFQVEATIASAEAGVSGQPEMIPALTVQHDGANVSGPERAGVTAGETAPLIIHKHIFLDDVGGSV